MNKKNQELALIFKNMIHMLKYRNVKVDRFLNKNKKIKKLNNEKVEEIFNDILKFDNLLIIFYKKKISVKDMKLSLKKIEKEEYDHLMLITKVKFNSYINTELKKIDRYLEVFLFKNFHINIIDHILVPKHILLTEKEKNKMIEKFGKNKLPQIKFNDPISRYFNCQVGDIFKIYRKNEMYYRIVSN
jgi:DNA-directed RNA polymerase I, II, and III subunit RPABC1